MVGDVTGGPSQGEITTVISDGAVSLAKLGGIQSERLLGRISAGTGVPQELTYQQVANALSGTDVGDLVELEDVGGGVAGLPAVDASQLLNVPAGVPNVTVLDEGVAVTTALESLNVTGNFLQVSATGNNVTLNSTAGDALTSQGLGQFASTTSAELATVITNETGTGSLVFGTAPTISNANLTGTPTAPTATTGTSTTQIATTAFVQQELGAFSGGLNGTGVDNQVAIWSSVAGTLEGDVSLTFDTTTDTLSVGESGSFTFGAVTILDDNLGVTTLSNIDAIDTTTRNTLETSLLSDVVFSDTTVLAGSDPITNIIAVSQAQYDALGTPDPTTFYVIKDAPEVSGGLTVAFHNTATLSPSIDTHYIVDTTTTPVVATLPGSPTNGAIIGFSDFLGNFGTNPLTINASGTDTLFNGVDTQLVLDSDFQVVELAYWDGNWSVTNAESFVDNGIGGSGFADPMTTAGDIIIRNGSNTTTRLGIGSEGQVLKVSSGVPTWAAESGGGLSNPVAYITQSVQTVTLNGVGGTTSQMDNGTHNVFSLTVNANTTIAHSNVPTTGTRYGFELHLSWSSGTITWPTSWTKGDDATALTAGNYTITGVTIDGGTSWKIAILAE